MSQSRNNDGFPRDRDAWREAYDAYIPVFYGILGRLARQGFVNRNSQGLEIIHDFFTHVWPHLGERYDSEQGSMDAYVTGAFARFARRTLVRDAFWFRHLTAEPDQLDSGRLGAGQGFAGRGFAGQGFAGQGFAGHSGSGHSGSGHSGSGQLAGRPTGHAGAHAGGGLAGSAGAGSPGAGSAGAGSAGAGQAAGSLGLIPGADFDPIDLQKVSVAMLSLPSEDRELLSARYGHEPLSERELTRRYGWTRYTVRDKLTRALVKVSCALGDSGLLSEEELKLANALFYDGRDVKDVAASFNLTEPQVRQARTSILKAIGDALGGSS